ncbi:class I SAM-dependent methyltransferase [Sorangium cellulosum]|nr:class I SAM-dependent methyltransferase [Sorangium cellulosum]
MRQRLDLTDLYHDAYTAYVEAFRRQTELVASEILLEHLLDQSGAVKALEGRPEAAPSVTAYQFHKKLLDYFSDKGELIPGEDGRLLPSEAVRRRVADKESASAADRATLGEMFEFLQRYRGLAGPVLAGKDALATMDLQFGMQSSLKFWEYSMIRLPAKKPCNVMLARVLLAKLAESPGISVFEGGAGLGVVLREALSDPRFLPLSKNLARYDYTDISALLMEAGKQWLRTHAPADLFQRIQFQRLDLDALSTAGNAFARAASVDLIVLEHVLYDVRDLHATLQAFHTMLKPGGQLAFTMSFRDRPSLFFPNEFFQSMLHTYNKAKLDPPRREHVGYLTLREWELSLRAAGFSEWEVYPAPEDHAKWPFGGIVAYR